MKIRIKLKFSLIITTLYNMEVITLEAIDKLTD